MSTARVPHATDEGEELASLIAQADALAARHGTHASHELLEHLIVLRLANKRRDSEPMKLLMDKLGDDLHAAFATVLRPVRGPFQLCTPELVTKGGRHPLRSRTKRAKS